MLLVGVSGGGPRSWRAAAAACGSVLQAAASHSACEVLLRRSARSTHQHGVQAASACAIQGRRPRARYTPGEAAALTRLSVARARRPWVE
jgi:hypothetical protein